jgi:hypothetical protein
MAGEGRGSLPTELIAYMGIQFVCLPSTIIAKSTDQLTIKR